MSEPYKKANAIAYIHSEKENGDYIISKITHGERVVGYTAWSSAAAQYIYGSLDCPMDLKRCWQIVSEHC